jgi:DGQHR domain-containing protein
MKRFPVPKRRKKRKQRKPIDPQKKIQLTQKRKARSVLERVGFSRIPSDGISFTFASRTGEIDDIFLMENVILVCEYTIESGTAHLAKKSILFNNILAEPERWVREYGEVNANFKTAIAASAYHANEFRVRILYVSEDVSDELKLAYPDYVYMYGNCLRYFEALTKTIFKSAAAEFLSFVHVEYSEFGDQVKEATKLGRDFEGHLLPESKSGYPDGTRIVSFYADPENLLKLCYVLRKDGWRDSEGLYQRILMKGKILKMRKYLSEEGRVFVNNIIVTLPSATRLINKSAGGKSLNETELKKAQVVTVNIPYLTNVVGLIDGQHRVFCYFRGGDKYEAVISKVRGRQNLLVTGLILPEDLNDEEKRRFEARLFLEINDNQAKARSALKQSIELMLNPFSVVAICKDIANKLASTGALKNLLQSHHFDPPEKIKTTSIVSYGLRPLVKLSGVDSLYHAWPESNKGGLLDDSLSLKAKSELREKYVSYCVECINALLVAAKLVTGPDLWKLQKARADRFVSPTLINGFLACLRRLAQENQVHRSKDSYLTPLKPLKQFKFSKYRSSGWKRMGDDIYDACFAD